MSGGPRLWAQRWLFRTEAAAPWRLVGAAVGRRAAGRVLVARGSAGPGRVVVVGGGTVGGAGRTAVVQWLAERALAQGLRVAVVAHGYRGQRRGRVPPSGGAAFGDDAALLARALPAAWVEVGPRGPTAARLARGFDRVFTDGGLLDQGVAADLVLAVLDVTAPPGVWPAGPWRVPARALGPGVLRWAHRVGEPGARPLEAGVFSRVVGRRLWLPGGETRPCAWLTGRPVRPVCGVARPGSFLATLEGLGARVEAPVIRADHHRFSLEDRPLGSAAGLWITTTKDFARWPAGWPVVVLETDLEVTGPGLAALDG